MNTSSCYLGITVSVGAYIYVALAIMHQILLEFVQNPFHRPKALSSSSRRLDIHLKGHFTRKHLLNEDKISPTIRHQNAYAIFLRKLFHSPTVTKNHLYHSRSLNASSTSISILYACNISITVSAMLSLAAVSISLSCS